MSEAYKIKNMPILGKDHEAVFDSDGSCIGIVQPSIRYPYKRMFFSYDKVRCYYGMSSVEAVTTYFASVGDVNA